MSRDETIKVTLGWGPPIEAKVIYIPAHSRIRREDVPALIERVRTLGVEASSLEEKILQGKTTINGHPLLVID